MIFRSYEIDSDKYVFVKQLIRKKCYNNSKNVLKEKINGGFYWQTTHI